MVIEKFANRMHRESLDIFMKKVAHRLLDNNTTEKVLVNIRDLCSWKEAVGIGKWFSRFLECGKWSGTYRYNEEKLKYMNEGYLLIPTTTTTTTPPPTTFDQFACLDEFRYTWYDSKNVQYPYAALYVDPRDITFLTPRCRQILKCKKDIGVTRDYLHYVDMIFNRFHFQRVLSSADYFRDFRSYVTYFENRIITPLLVDIRNLCTWEEAFGLGKWISRFLECGKCSTKFPDHDIYSYNEERLRNTRWGYYTNWG
ncbi:hypothetical protein L3Y34_009387 [Caenorhabditis briggsae]|uniref:Uncharacterized protein n=1 Tax=Caenorhabditis briggsae TaxID=6238 RepID=A0AAE9D450_CAEBR|nr:hypothetical protein L3Y34_009387 [Caenorhabditis briggsae]